MKLGLNERLTVTLTAEEKAIVVQAAQEKGITMSAYARAVLVKDAESIVKKANRSK